MGGGEYLLHAVGCAIHYSVSTGRSTSTAQLNVTLLVASVAGKALLLQATMLG